MHDTTANWEPGSSQDVERLPSARVSRRRFLAYAGVAVASLALGGVASACASTSSGSVPGYRVPLDSLPHTRTWMAWPDSLSICGGRLLPKIQSDIALIAKTIADFEPVFMIANSGSVPTAKSKCGSGVTVIGSIPLDDCWLRDSGPIFRINGGGGLDAVGLNFNGWGDKQTHAKDARVAQRIVAYLGVPFTAAGLISEGRAIETDGTGTLMATKSSIINSNRNPGKTQAQLEAAMCAAYNACKVIWFPGVSGKDITDDHVDATSRFIGDHKALVQIPQASDTTVWATDEEQQLATLQASTEASGSALEVTRVMEADYSKIRQKNNDNYLAAYPNYYVCNGAVICQNTGDTTNDNAATTALGALFPGRTIVSLNIDNLATYGGGGIHCVTQQQPKP